jgi:hypothetical protein
LRGGKGGSLASCLESDIERDKNGFVLFGEGTGAGREEREGIFMSGCTGGFRGATDLELLAREAAWKGL